MYYTGSSKFAQARGYQTDQGPGAIRFLVGDVDGDKKDDIIQLWNCNNRLCILYYTVCFANNFNTMIGR